MIKKIAKILLAVAVPVALVCLIVFIVKFSNINTVRSKTPEQKYQVTVGEEIAYGRKDVLVAENDTKRLYVNPEMLNIIVEDKATGQKWQAVYEDGSEDEQYLLAVTYVGEDNAFTTWDSMEYCVANYIEGEETPQFRIFQLENGVRISMHISEGASKRFYEYMPRKMSVHNYKEVFTAGLERLLEEGTVTEKEYKKYDRALRLNYKKSLEGEFYNVTSVGSPANSASKQLIELSKMVGYTKEMLLQDAEDFDFVVEFMEPALFDITVDFMLEGDELVVNIPVDQIVNGNDFYTLQNIEVLTNFGLVKNSTVDEGYLFVPDGAGALLSMNTFDAKVPDYSRGLFNNDYFTDYYYKAEFGQELMMPVFGMYTLSAPAKEDGTPVELLQNGFMTVVENGADTAYVKTMLASDGNDGSGRNYNKIYSSYDVAQYEWVPIFGEYSDNKSTYLSIAPQTAEDYTLRYFFFTGEETSYYQMAKTYQNYLCKGETPGVYQTGAQLFLEVIGTLSLEERFLGIPYNTEYSMTTYNELAAILDDLEGRHANISYKGIFDGGMNHKLMNGGKLMSENGTKEELDALIAKVEGASDSIFLETDFMRVYEGGNGFFKATHGLEDYSKTPVNIYGYRVELGQFKELSNMYHMLDPKYLVDTVNDFIKRVDGDYNYYVNDLTEQYYADYGNGYVSPQEAQRLINQALEALAAKSELALDNPRMDKLQNGTIAVDVSRESSELNSFYTSIPFRQLVLNGMMEYTTTTANNNSDPASYYLMQAIETGSQPKFTITSKKVDVLNSTKYSYYFSVQYELLEEEIKAVYDEFEAAMNIIGTAEIVNHSMLAQDVFLTEYKNGTKVITNYTFDEYEYNDGVNNVVVLAEDYTILKGGN